MTELYLLLGLTPSATHEDIRGAYRKLVKTHHPDAGGDPELFAKIALAHEVLTDPQRRSVYDATGHFDTKADNDDAATISLIEHLLGKVIAGTEAAGQDPLAVDLIAGMRLMLEEADKMARNDLTKMNKEWDRYNVLISRFKRADDGPNHFATILAHKMDLLRRRMGVATEALRQHENCRQYLAGCQYQRPYLMGPVTVTLNMDTDIFTRNIEA